MDSRAAGWGLLGRALVICLFLCGFPLLLADGALGYLLELRSQNLETKRYRELEGRTRRFIASREPPALVRRTLRALVRRAEKHPRPINRLADLILPLIRRYPHLFTIIVFDPRGRAAFQADGHESLPLAERLLDKLWKSRAGTESLDFRKHPDLAAFLGRRIDPAFCNALQYRDWLDVGDPEIKSAFFYHLGPKFSMIAFVNWGWSPAFLGFRTLLDRLATKKSRVDLVDFHRMEMPFTKDRAFQKLALQVAARWLREPLTRVEAFDRLWTINQFSPDTLILASRQIDPSPQSGVTQGKFRATALCFFLLAWTGCWLWFRFDWQPYLSLRWKLLALFLMAGGLPLVILAFLLTAYVREREELLIFRKEADSHRVLDNLDARFPFAIDHCARALNHLVDRLQEDSPGGIFSYARNFREFLAPNRCREVRILGADGQEVVLRPPGKPIPDVGGGIFRLLQTVLRRLRGEYRPEDIRFLVEMGYGRNQAAKLTPELLLDNLIGQEGVLAPVVFGPTETYLIFRTIFLRGSRPEYLIAAQWDREDLKQVFSRRYVPMKPLDDGTELLLVSFVRRYGMVRPKAVAGRTRGGKPIRVLRTYFTCYPNRPVRKDFLRVFHRLYNEMGRITDRVTYKGRLCLVCAKPGNSLDNQGIFALTPLTEIEATIRDLKHQIFFLSFFSLGFTSLLGLLLARKFLGPIREIGLAVEAVAGEQFDYRIPPQDADELGALTQQFNRMMESLKEVSVAKRVQEKLMPRRSLELGRFRVYGHSIPATDLGGDYFDFLALPDDRLLVLHGDVAGHGIPAALVMAMVKAIVTHFGSAPLTPEDLLAALSSVIFRAMGGWRGMTLAILEIDTRTQTGRLFNCGNPYPLLLRQGRPIEEKKVKGQILGIREKVRAIPAPMDLQPGERLLFYSDGLAESLDRGETSGFTLFVEFAEKLPWLPLEDFCRSVISEHPVTRLHQTQADDFTVVVVERVG